MKKVTTILVLLMCVSLSMTAYAQSEQSEIDAANEQAAADAAKGQIITEVDEGVLAQQKAMEAMENENAVWPYADVLPGNGTIEAPYEYWEQNGYPANVSFVFQVGDEPLEDGTSITYWEIGIVNADESSKREILDMLSPNCRITFNKYTYSHNQSEAVRNEILAMNDEKIIDAIVKKNTDGIFVIVKEDSVDYYREILIARFGDIISIGGDESTPVTAALNGNILNADAPLLASHNWIFPAILILLCGIAAMLYITRARFIPAMHTNSGNIVTGNAPIGRKHTVAAIRNSALTPSDDVFKSIMERIDNQKP